MINTGRKLIAILKGIKPIEVVEVGHALEQGGINCIEVSLESPEPYDSIKNLARSPNVNVLVGAGDVTCPSQIENVWDSGGDFIVSNHLNTSVIKETKLAGMISCSGVSTPTEVHQAIEAGADILQLSPAAEFIPSKITSLKDEMPIESKSLYLAGGVEPLRIKEYINYGIELFGFGSPLYKPNYDMNYITEKAKMLCQFYDRESTTSKNSELQNVL